MRILVEGVDLTGKSTLVRGLAAALSARGLAVTVRTGPERAGLLCRLAWRRYRGGADPAARLQSWLFAAAELGAALRPPPRPQPGTVLIQIASIDHTIALCEALGRRVAAALLRAARARAPAFDATLLCRASLEVRRVRLCARRDANALDRLLVERPRVAERFEARLEALVARRPRLLLLDSSRESPAAMAARALRHLYPNPATRTSAVARPSSATT